MKRQKRLIYLAHRGDQLNENGNFLTSREKLKRHSDRISRATIIATWESGLQNESIQQMNGKCGEIFVERIYDSDVFSFTCVFCEKATFTEILEFFEHFKDFHTKSCIINQEFDPLELSNDGSEKIIKIEDNFGQTDSIEGYDTVIIDSNELEIKEEISDNYIKNTISQKEPSKMNKNRRQSKFPCEMCDKKYLVESLLRRHIRLVHKNVGTNYAKKREPLLRQTKQLVNLKQNNELCIRNDYNLEDDEEFEFEKSNTELCIRNDCKGEDDEEFAFERSNTETLKTDEYSHDENSLENLNKYVQNDSDDTSMNTAKSDKKKVFSCKICNKKYGWKSSVSRHMRYAHSSSECISTGLLSDDEGKELDLKEHEENVIAITYTDPLECRYCGLRMNERCNIIVHERIHTGERPFKCKFCDKCFRTSSYVKLHEKIHQGIKPHKCEICNAAFTLKSNLKQHIRRHLGDKKLPCQYCGKLFQENNDRKTHERSHTGEKPFQCSVCGKCFSKNQTLRRHSLRHTNNKRFKCEFCEKNFYTKRGLMDHNVSHTGEKPFKCHICNASFPRQRALKSHMKLHSETAEYVCTICGKGFKQRPGLYCHMKSHGIPITS